MAHDPVEKLRSLVMFVIAWLIALYVYEVVQSSFQTGVGVAAAVGTGILNLYARRRAANCPATSWAFKFWLYLPVILFLVVPVAAKTIGFLANSKGLTWWQQVYALLPFMLKLGVPVAGLLWVYWRLGGWERVERDADVNR